MKSIYILLVLILAASVLGCVGQKPSEVTTPVSPTETPISPAGTPAPASIDEFGTQSDVNAMDSVVNDSSMDIPLSDATI